MIFLDIKGDILLYSPLNCVVLFRNDIRQLIIVYTLALKSKFNDFSGMKNLFVTKTWNACINIRQCLQINHVKGNKGKLILFNC